MKLFFTLFLVLTIHCTLVLAEPKAADELELGGVYAVKSDAGYHLAKITALEMWEDGVYRVGVRYYVEDVKEVPQTIDTKKLTVFMHRYVTTYDDFARFKPIKIGQEKIEDNEKTLNLE
jgi:hypothetical protein